MVCMTAPISGTADVQCRVLNTGTGHLAPTLSVEQQMLRSSLVISK